MKSQSELRKDAEKLVDQVRALDGCVGGHEESAAIVLEYRLQAHQAGRKEMREEAARVVRADHAEHSLGCSCEAQIRLLPDEEGEKKRE